MVKQTTVRTLVLQLQLEVHVPILNLTQQIVLTYGLLLVVVLPRRAEMMHGGILPQLEQRLQYHTILIQETLFFIYLQEHVQQI